MKHTESNNNEKLCRVVTDKFVAGAVFSKTDRGWQVVRCAPVLYWWRQTPFENIKRFMQGPAKKAGWSWEWL